MIWPEIVPFLLAVVARTAKLRRWINATMNLGGEAHSRECCCFDCMIERGSDAYGYLPRSRSWTQVCRSDRPGIWHAV